MFSLCLSVHKGEGVTQPLVPGPIPASGPMSFLGVGGGVPPAPVIGPVQRPVPGPAGGRVPQSGSQDRTGGTPPPRDKDKRYPRNRTGGR